MNGVRSAESISKSFLDPILRTILIPLLILGIPLNLGLLGLLLNDYPRIFRA